MNVPIDIKIFFWLCLPTLYTRQHINSKFLPQSVRQLGLVKSWQIVDKCIANPAIAASCIYLFSALVKSCRGRDFDRLNSALKIFQSLIEKETNYSLPLQPLPLNYRPVTDTFNEHFSNRVKIWRKLLLVWCSLWVGGRGRGGAREREEEREWKRVGVMNSWIGIPTSHILHDVECAKGGVREKEREKETIERVNIGVRTVKIRGERKAERWVEGQGVIKIEGIVNRGKKKERERERQELEGEKEKWINRWKERDSGGCLLYSIDCEKEQGIFRTSR